MIRQILSCNEKSFITRRLNSTDMIYVYYCCFIFLNNCSEYSQHFEYQFIATEISCWNSFVFNITGMMEVFVRKSDISIVDFLIFWLTFSAYQTLMIDHCQATVYRSHLSKLFTLNGTRSVRILWFDFNLRFENRKLDTDQ